jgi:hypothetical protein
LDFVARPFVNSNFITIPLMNTRESDTRLAELRVWEFPNDQIIENLFAILSGLQWLVIPTNSRNLFTSRAFHSYCRAAWLSIFKFTGNEMKASADAKETSRAWERTCSSRLISYN